jgi:Septum formation
VFTIKATTFAAGRAESEETCRDAVAAYLGSPDHASTRIRSEAVEPAEKVWAAGNRDGSCLVREVEPDLQKWVTRRGSLRNVLSGPERLHQYRLCGATKAGADTMRYIDCDRPHLAEALPISILLGTAADPYPGRAALNRQVGSQCRTALRAFLNLSGHRTDVVATWRMSSQQQWAAGHRTATCFAQVDSPIRKTLRALANRPLTPLR